MRKIILVTFFVAGATFGGQALAFGGFSLPGLDGGDKEKSAVNWDDLAGTGKGAVADIYVGAKLLGEAIGNMAEALDLKEQAGVLKTQADGISKDGTQSSDSNLKEIQNSANSTGILVLDQLAAADKLTVGQKKALGDAAVQYGIGAVRYVAGIKGGKDVVSQIGDAPLMQASKFVNLLKVVPVAANGGINMVSVGPKLFALMSDKGINTPSISDLPGTDAFN